MEETSPRHSKTNKSVMPRSRAVESRISQFEITAMEELITGKDGSEHANLYLGRAGEYFIAAELLRRGFNAMVAPVDTGVDVIAHSVFKREVPLLSAEHELFLFQVKTTSLDEYVASLSTRTVHEFIHKKMNLIVVFWPEGGVPSSIVLPPSLICMLTSGGFDDLRAPMKIGKKSVTLRVIRRGERYFLRNQANEITLMLNRFDRIESILSDPQMLPPYAVWGDDAGLVRFE